MKGNPNFAAGYRPRSRPPPRRRDTRFLRLVGALAGCTFLGVWGLLSPGKMTAGSSAFYLNCSAARAAGAAPLHSGEPGYRSGLDRDGDGIACEPYRGW